LVFPFGGKIQIGSNSYIGEGTRIWSAENIFIGNDVLISHNCNIIDTDSHEINYIERAERVKSIVATGHPSQKGTVQTAPIYISDHAWLSYNVSILKGVKIGKGAIVAAGSVVTKDVADFTVVAGNPAVFIKNIQ
jgi:maltose O-acetyltransferase